jgi:type II secretory pathway pseudopilin PulG
MAAKRFKQVDGAGESYSQVPGSYGAQPTAPAASARTPRYSATPGQQATSQQPGYAGAATQQPGYAGAAQTAPATSASGRKPRFSAPTTSTAGATGAYVAEGSPRPIGVDPATTGSFRTISQGGAVATTRENASAAAQAGRAGVARTVRAGQGTRKKPEPTKAPRGVIIGIVVAVAIIVILAFLLLSALITPSSTATEEAATSVAAQTVVAAEEGVEVGDYTYTLKQGDSGWELVRVASDGDSTLASLSGTPVNVCLYQGTLFIPENLADGTWDVICYVLGDGSAATQLLGSDGNALTGSGTIESASVDGSSLALTGDGVSQTVSLE